MSKRFFATVLWLLGFWILATSRPDEPSLEEWRQMGATAAYWEFGKPMASIAAIAIGVWMWRSKPTEPRHAGE
jgi:hypothetical protein